MPFTDALIPSRLRVVTSITWDPVWYFHQLQLAFTVAFSPVTIAASNTPSPVTVNCCLDLSAFCQIWLLALPSMAATIPPAPKGY